MSANISKHISQHKQPDMSLLGAMAMMFCSPNVALQTFVTNSTPVKTGVDVEPAGAKSLPSTQELCSWLSFQDPG